MPPPPPAVVGDPEEFFEDFKEDSALSDHTIRESIGDRKETQRDYNSLQKKFRNYEDRLFGNYMPPSPEDRATLDKEIAHWIQKARRVTQEMDPRIVKAMDGTKHAHRVVHFTVSPWITAAERSDEEWAAVNFSPLSTYAAQLFLAPSPPAVCPAVPAAAMMLGVYAPVDPAAAGLHYSAVYPSDPSPLVRETAGLVTELFELLIDMRYLAAGSVAFPPHRHLPVDPRGPARFGVAKDVVDLWQMLPYLAESPDVDDGDGDGDWDGKGRGREPNWNFGSDAGEFLRGGEFLDDLRGERDVDWWQVFVDPFYALGLGEDEARAEAEAEAEGGAADGEAGAAADDSSTRDERRGWDGEDGPYMRPWYATLSSCGNHGSIMVLDTKNDRMWLIDQLGGSTDPAFWDAPPLPPARNRNALEQYPSRPAGEFLRDVIARFRSLEGEKSILIAQIVQWIPGSLYGPNDGLYGGDDHRPYEAFRQLYLDCGWPDAFDPLEFDRRRLAAPRRYGEWSADEDDDVDDMAAAAAARTTTTGRDGEGDEEEHQQQQKQEPFPDLQQAIDRLYSQMALARDRVQQRIRLADATYRLSRSQAAPPDDSHPDSPSPGGDDPPSSNANANRDLNLDLSPHRRRDLEAWLHHFSPDRADPSDRARQWSSAQARLRTSLDFERADLANLLLAASAGNGGRHQGVGTGGTRTGTGRFGRAGAWAGVSDARLRLLAAAEAPARRSRIAALEARLADADEGARVRRELREAKAKAAALVVASAAGTGGTGGWETALALEREREAEEERRGRGWATERWSILGSGSAVADVRAVVEEDMSVEELERRIVHALEAREEPAWAGTLLWRNDDGVVAQPLD
ncbi:hypothetical protein GGR56DRAFT_695075 [Xylariaceae sp. FL0804]|nr:hypothetical protein GGR56DRAFT_695075 [Xylariaceae sp. FL0804]